MREPPSQPDGQNAEAIAIDALQFLAGRPEELGRFLALSGIDPANLRQLVADTAFLGGILDFLLEDEALLLVFAADTRRHPDAIAKARRQIEPAAQRALESGES